ncbi:MAG: hypothetical protein Q3972_00945 [Corynebacterium sp.]|nr:hypothetical protein [Corynebacterium sp.]
MEPVEINGGRFYVRPLHCDERIDDTHALSLIDATIPAELPQQARELWLSDTLYSWAVCEQTSVDLVALALYDPKTKELVVYPSGDPHRVLPNTDGLLRDKTPLDAVSAASETLSRWIEVFG